MSKSHETIEDIRIRARLEEYGVENVNFINNFSILINLFLFISN
jgi:hypothetical protein